MTNPLYRERAEIVRQLREVEAEMELLESETNTLHLAVLFSKKEDRLGLSDGEHAKLLGLFPQILRMSDD